MSSDMSKNSAIIGPTLPTQRVGGRRQGWIFPRIGEICGDSHKKVNLRGSAGKRHFQELTSITSIKYLTSIYLKELTSIKYLTSMIYLKELSSIKYLTSINIWKLSYSILWKLTTLWLSNLQIKSLFYKYFTMNWIYLSNLFYLPNLSYIPLVNSKHFTKHSIINRKKHKNKK